MSPRPDHNQYVRQVVLPSGRTIDVVYFDGAAARSALPERAPTEDLHVCRHCSSELVYPVDWEEAGDSAWQVELRCPNCEWTGTGVHDQDVVERFDAELDRGTEDLLADLRGLSRANLEEDVERFVAALQAGHILPCDF